MPPGPISQSGILDISFPPDGKIGSSVISNGAITEQKLATAVQTKLNRQRAVSGSDYGLLVDNMELPTITGSISLSTAGSLYVMKLRTDVAITITNIHMFVLTAGATLTAGQNFAAIYNSAKQLVGQTADQATAWQSTGMKTMTLTSPAQISAGVFYVVLVSNGTTRPSIRGGASGTGSVNGLLPAADAMFAIADTGVTTTLPATLGTFSLDQSARWVGVS